ncbi:hypothetical protein OBBRIDRAFT_742165, partial [Obba rivulosa]
WRDRQPWLQERGYALRPRYRPTWVPSWRDTGKFWVNCEDSLTVVLPHLLDATRISDGTMVLLKKISLSKHPHEIEINKFFSSEPLSSSERNHCVPLYEVLDVPEDGDTKLLVMPFLRQYNNPQIATVGEAAEFFRQIFEGLQFMHEHRVAHRDCMSENIMMDPKPLYPKMFHPVLQTYNRDRTGRAKHYTRTKRPVKYYFIDFGISRRYTEGEDSSRELLILGADRSIPEFVKYRKTECDPFPTDVYYLGNLIQKEFLERTHGVEFMRPLVTDMLQDDPAHRPTIHQVVERFNEIRKGLSNRQLRSKLVDLENDIIHIPWVDLRHMFRKLYYILFRYPALPTVRS